MQLKILQNLLSIKACKTVSVYIIVRLTRLIKMGWQIMISILFLTSHNKKIIFLLVFTGLVAAAGCMLAWNLLVLIFLQFISSHKKECCVPEKYQNI